MEDGRKVRIPRLPEFAPAFPFKKIQMGDILMKDDHVMILIVLTLVTVTKFGFISRQRLTGKWAIIHIQSPFPIQINQAK